MLVGSSQLEGSQKGLSRRRYQHIAGWVRESPSNWWETWGCGWGRERRAPCGCARRERPCWSGGWGGCSGILLERSCCISDSRYSGVERNKRKRGRGKEKDGRGLSKERNRSFWDEEKMHTQWYMVKVTYSKFVRILYRANCSMSFLFSKEVNGHQRNYMTNWPNHMASLNYLFYDAAFEPS